MSQTVGCETQMNCDDSWVPSCLFYSLKAAHIWLYIFLSPDLTHQYLYFLKLALPWIIPLKGLISKYSPTLGIWLSLLPTDKYSEIILYLSPRVGFDHFLICSLLGLDTVLYSSISIQCLKSFQSPSSAGCFHRTHFFSICFELGTSCHLNNLYAIPVFENLVF